MLVHLDDYVSAHRKGLEKLLSEIGDVEFCVHALMSGSCHDDLRTFPVKVGLHGWNHFCEPQMGYWEARHLLETAKSRECFDPVFKMPWNAMPRPGFLKALRESEFALITPYRWQAVIATVVGCRVKLEKPDFLLHPPDLVFGSEQIEKLKEEKCASDDWLNPHLREMSLTSY